MWSFSQSAKTIYSDHNTRCQDPRENQAQLFTDAEGPLGDSELFLWLEIHFQKVIADKDPLPWKHIQQAGAKEFGWSLVKPRGT